MKLKKILPEKSRFYWRYFIAGAIALVLGIFLLPVWGGVNVFWSDWGSIAVNLLIFLCIAAYVLLYLVPRIQKERDSIKILMVVEIALFVVVALGCVLEQFDIVRLGSPSAILGMALWLRGAVYAVKGYFYRHTADEKKYKLLDMFCAIALITVGTVLVARPILTERDLIWFGSVSVIVLAVIFIIFGFIAKPTKQKVRICS